VSYKAIHRRNAISDTPVGDALFEAFEKKRAIAGDAGSL
jgi:hypothetical protein